MTKKIVEPTGDPESDKILFDDQPPPAKPPLNHASEPIVRGQGVEIACADRAGAAVWLPDGSVLKAGETVEVSKDDFEVLNAAGAFDNGFLRCV